MLPTYTSGYSSTASPVVQTGDIEDDNNLQLKEEIRKAEYPQLEGMHTAFPSYINSVEAMPN